MIGVVYRLTGRSVSSSLRTDLPSISAGISIPAMSSTVGAKSIFNTMCGFLQSGETVVNPTRHWQKLQSEPD